VSLVIIFKKGFQILDFSTFQQATSVCREDTKKMPPEAGSPLVKISFKFNLNKSKIE